MKGRKKKGQALTLREDELTPGVSKLLISDNERQKFEIDGLKKSLSHTQDELEKLRSHNHELDKSNVLLNYRLTNAFIPEILKFLASSVGTGFAISLLFYGDVSRAIIVLTASVLVYGGILLKYRK